MDNKPEKKIFVPSVNVMLLRERWQKSNEDFDDTVLRFLEMPKIQDFFQRKMIADYESKVALLSQALHDLVSEAELTPAEKSGFLHSLNSPERINQQMLLILVHQELIKRS